MIVPTSRPYSADMVLGNIEKPPIMPVVETPVSTAHAKEPNFVRCLLRCKFTLTLTQPGNLLNYVPIVQCVTSFCDNATLGTLLRTSSGLHAFAAPILYETMELAVCADIIARCGPPEATEHPLGSYGYPTLFQHVRTLDADAYWVPIDMSKSGLEHCFPILERIILSTRYGDRPDSCHWSITVSPTNGLL